MRGRKEDRRREGRKMVKMKKGIWFAMKTENEGKVEKMKNGGRKRKKAM